MADANASGPSTSMVSQGHPVGTQWGPGGPQAQAQSQGSQGLPTQGQQHGQQNLPPPPYPSHQGANVPLRIENDSIQALFKSVKLVQKLRSSVSLTFQHLADGVKHVTPNDTEVSSQHLNPDGNMDLGSSTSGSEDEKILLEELKKDLKQVGDALTEVENHINVVQDQSPQQHYSRSASFLLPLDSVNVGDKHQLSTQLYHSHRWLDKLHEFASVSYSVLGQNSTRRSASQGQARDGAAGSSMAAKRLKIKGTTSQQVSVSPAAIDQFVSELGRSFHPNVVIKLSRPLGNPALLNITLARTLKAHVILRGFIIEWVNVLGLGELQSSDFEVGDGTDQGASLDTVWNKSRHQVFRRISDHAAAAMIHFYLPNNPELALRSFLMWLNSYAKLFSDPCNACHKIIQSSDGSVPVFRDLRTLKPYHDLCRP